MVIPLHVLIADDSLDAALSAVGALERDGYGVSWRRARDANELLAALQQEAWDLVIVGDTGPEVTLPHALANIREVNHEVPVIVMGASAREGGHGPSPEDPNTFFITGELTGLPAVLKRRLATTRTGDDGPGLANSEESYRALFENAPEAIYIQARDGTFLDVNHHVEEMYGYPREFFIGRSPADLTAPGKNDMESVAALVADTFENGTTHTFEFWGRDARGRVFPKEVIVTAGTYQGERVVIAFSRDISERVAADAQLRLLTRALEASANAIVLTSSTGTVEWVNPAFTSLTGYTQEEAVGENPRILKSGKQNRAFYSKMWKTILSGAVWHGELINSRKDGSEYTEEMTITPVRDETTGAITHFIAIKQDITERKRLEEAAHRSQQMLELVLDSIPQRVFWKDRQSRYLGCNSLFAHDAGFDDPRDIIGRDDFAMGWSENAARYRADDELVMSTGEPKLGYEEPQVRPDGTQAWLRTSKVPLRDQTGAIIGVLGTYEDITEEKRTREELRKSEERYRDLVEHTHELMVTHTPEGIILTSNRALEDFLGKSENEIRGIDMHSLLPPSAWEEFDYQIKRIFSEEEVSGLMKIQLPEGDTRTVEYTSSLIKTASGSPIVRSLGRDITDAWHARRRLEASEKRYRELVERAGIGIMTDDLDGRLTFINDQACAVLGYAREELLGRSLLELVHPEDRDRARTIHEEKVAANGGSTDWYEFRGLRRDGSTFYAEVNLSPRHQDGRMTGFQIYMRDVTRRKELEAQLLQAQKLESIGRLAGGVAHDFNNVLQAIFGNLDLIPRERVDSGVRSHIDAASKAAERAARLTRQLLAFSRRQVIQPAPVDLNEVLASMVEMLRNIVGEEISLIFEPHPEQVALVADRGQLEQILLNLVVNARDATGPGGQITITTLRIEPDDAFRSSHPWAVSPVYAVFSVQDTGSGIAPEIQERIFDPFFTTKDMTRGTGLGLATVHGIVTQHGGHIDVESRPGEGATFTIYLPASTQAVPQPQSRAHTSQAPAGQGEWILFAEDDAEVREVVRSVLEDAGYIVVEAEDGIEAERLFAEKPDAFKLAILDVVMPRLGGGEAAQRIRKLMPGIPVIFSSGYSDDIVESRIELDGNTRLLSKPYNIAELLRTVREVLDAASQD